MKTLLTADLHFTDRPRDRYRFDFFDFLLEQQEACNASLIRILGDCTDFKDNHSSFLVNQIVGGLKKLADRVKVDIIMGNHDFQADPKTPFFKFLNEVPNIRFYTKPTVKGNVFYIPHINDEEEWDNLRCDKPIKFAFIHQCVTGAVSESGRRLDGSSLKPLKRFKCPVYAGDIHRPQTIGPVTYIGSPYHIRFGDEFKPRVLLLDERTGKTKDLYTKFPSKWSLIIRDPEELLDMRLRKGDQAKITLELASQEVVEWPNHKRRILQVLGDLGVETYGVSLKPLKGKSLHSKEVGNVTANKVVPTHQEVLGSFCDVEKLPRAIRQAGKRLLEA